ncbi:MAG TPA: 50S ribosomal protein L3 [Gemmataceae bacterium]|jgi:large subunit ribosomal protein L3|nr:50S ribosomal protein L3 [Gemmataceae bacterium]
MPMGLLGTKVGMTQVYVKIKRKQKVAKGKGKEKPKEEVGKTWELYTAPAAAAADGQPPADDQDTDLEMWPVTVLQVGPCPVLQVRSPENDGYHGIQIGYLEKPRRSSNRAERGHVRADLESKRRAKGVPLAPKANCEPPRHVSEFRLEKAPESAVGTVLTAAEVLKDVRAVDIIGFSKGRGMTGVMKRHNFGGLRRSHGVKKGSRQHGSIASNASNRGSGRPKKGIRMAGRYGNERVTVRNLRVVQIDPDLHVVLVKGAIPGANGGVILIRPTNKLRRKPGGK